MLKHSQFNHLAQVPGEEEWALVNFHRGTVAKLDSVQKKLFDIAPSLRADLPVVRNWQQGGFLVDEDVDEVAQVRYQVRRFHDGFSSGAQKRPLEMVVAVTSACNFACPYCFQDRRGGHMAPEVRDALVRFVERRLASGQHSHLGVEWFGGEPLLAPEVIDELSSQFMNLADRYGVTYSAMIHTNGYLLDQDMVDFLEARAVKAAIVPLDGMAEAHDATRYLRGGAPTFERIMGNLLDEGEGGSDAWASQLDDATRAYRFPDEQPKCLACKYLPCCLGGCPMKRMLTGEAECPSALFDPDGFALSCLKDSAMKPRQR